MNSEPKLDQIERNGNQKNIFSSSTRKEFTEHKVSIPVKKAPVKKESLSDNQKKLILNKIDPEIKLLSENLNEKVEAQLFSSNEEIKPSKLSIILLKIFNFL